MDREFQQYRFGRIEGHRVTRARLEKHFKYGIASFDELERAVAQELATKSPCAPWRQSETDRAGCCDGMRLAALEFFWENRRAVKEESSLQFAPCIWVCVQ